MLIAAAALLVAPPAYTITPMFTSETPGAECFSLNDKSQVICNVSDPSDSSAPVRGFVWQGGKLTEIKAPAPDPDHIVSISPIAINNGGVVVGDVNRTTLDQRSSTWEGFRWNAKDGMEKLVVNGHQFDVAAINDKGEIAGKVAHSDDPELPWTFGVLTATKGFVPYFPADDRTIYAAINDKGLIAGVQVDTNRFTQTAFHILPGETKLSPLALPPQVDLPSDPSRNVTGYVTAMNKDGWTVGIVNMKTTGKPVQDHLAAVWSPDNTFYSLGAGHRALDINDKGQVVGCRFEAFSGSMSGRGSLDAQAFVYDAKNGIRYLNTLLPVGSPSVTRAISINNKGEIVCSGPRGWYLLSPSK